MNSTVILIILAIVVGIAYFSVRNARKQKEKKTRR